MPRVKKRPTFLWQGLLIVLPAFVLAGVGLYSLRQDRLLARHQAAEEARRLAEQLAVEIDRAWRPREAPSAGEIRNHQAAPDAVVKDPLLLCLQDGLCFAAGYLSADGDLEYPPPPAPWPAPDPLNVNQLSTNQWAHWLSLQNRLDEEAQQPNPPDFSETHAAFHAFAASDPPARFAALARYQIACALQKHGNFIQATPHFEWLVRNASAVAAESGFALKPWVLLNLGEAALSLGQRSQAADWLDQAVADSLANPTPISAAVRQAARALWNGHDESGSRAADSPLKRWDEAEEGHEATRRLLSRPEVTDADEDASPGSDVTWVTIAGRGDCLLVSVPANSASEEGRWRRAISEAGLRARAMETIEAYPIPEFFGVAVSLAGRALIGGMSGEALARNAEPGNGRAAPEVTVYLARPDLLDARQRQRSARFAALIGAAAAAVLAGFWTARRAFQHQQRLNEMQADFVSSVSHEIRAPIASVRLMAEELDHAGPNDRQKNKQYHGFIAQECRRLSALIENVLDFSRHEQGRKRYEFAEVDVEKLSRETLERLGPYAAEKEVRLDLRSSGNAVPISADASALRQALVNLLDNAIKHAPPETAVVLTLDYQPRRLIVAVEDAGPGIPEDEHESIFERFYRRGSELRRETQGIGLGLAIVRYVVEAHSGAVRVESAPGRGSRFIIELPVGVSASSSAQERPIPAP